MVKIVLNCEGIINTPVDFTWIMYQELISEETKRKFSEAVIKTFEKYDYMRWKRQRKQKGHSIGATPLLIDCVAACDGISDSKIIELACSYRQENPGIEKVFDFLKKEHFMQPFIVTNSYPALPLMTAYKYGIGSSKVFTHGYQLSEREKKFLDSREILDLEKEVHRRSPLPSLKPKEELENFLREYLNHCTKSLYAELYEVKLRKLTREEIELFKSIKDKDLRKTLQYMFLLEEGIMGGHRKVDVLKKIKDKDKIVYLGDSVEDADAIRFADYGFAVNCTDEHSLLDATLNLALSNFSDLIPLLKDILDGRFVIADAKKI